MTALEFQGLLEEHEAYQSMLQGWTLGPGGQETFPQNPHSAVPVDPMVPGQQLLGVPGEGYSCQEPVGEWRNTRHSPTQLPTLLGPKFFPLGILPLGQLPVISW